MKTEVRDEIKTLLIETVRAKLENYNPETEYMPFHHRLIGRDKYAIFSFIQSINTTFGMSIWEQTAEILAKGAGFTVKRQVDVLNGELRPCRSRKKAERWIFAEMMRFIDGYMEELLSGLRDADKEYELRTLRSLRKGKTLNVAKDCADLYILTPDGSEYFIDITSVKPNKKEFKAMKRKLLIWQAIRISGNPDIHVEGRLAVPYNPYHPQPYERWTLKGLYDLAHGEVMVGEEFWNFVAGAEVYGDLLDVFSEVGEILRPEIDKFFARFRG